MLPLDPWEQPACLSPAEKIKLFVDSGAHMVASTTKDFMRPLNEQQIEIHMELMADKALERTFS